MESCVPSGPCPTRKETKGPGPEPTGPEPLSLGTEEQSSGHGRPSAGHGLEPGWKGAHLALALQGSASGRRDGRASRPALGRTPACAPAVPSLGHSDAQGSEEAREPDTHSRTGQGSRRECPSAPRSPWCAETLCRRTVLAWRPGPHTPRVQAALDTVAHAPPFEAGCAQGSRAPGFSHGLCLTLEQ